jgi:hypothetical protein
MRGNYISPCQSSPKCQQNHAANNQNEQACAALRLDPKVPIKEGDDPTRRTRIAPLDQVAINCARDGIDGWRQDGGRRQSASQRGRPVVAFRFRG